MKAFVKITLALMVVASLLPISEASAGRRRCRKSCNTGCYTKTCGPTGCYTRTCGPSGCQVYLGK